MSIAILFFFLCGMSCQHWSLLVYCKHWLWIGQLNISDNLFHCNGLRWTSRMISQASRSLKSIDKCMQHGRHSVTKEKMSSAPSAHEFSWHTVATPAAYEVHEHFLPSKSMTLTPHWVYLSPEFHIKTWSTPNPLTAGMFSIIDFMSPLLL